MEENGRRRDWRSGKEVGALAQKEDPLEMLLGRHMLLKE
jgi:hypothetical protein